MGNIEIKDFILQQDEFLTPEECQEFIDIYHRFTGHSMVFSRQESENASHVMKADTAQDIFADKPCFDILSVGNSLEIVKQTMQKFWETFNVYSDKYFDSMDNDQLASIHFKIQKTEPQEGYHVWHFENASPNISDRVCAWMIYFNDVEDGGETEFLYQQTRVKPKAGKLVIWPAYFTHLHRGNPPLSGTKYAATGWITYS